MMSMHKRRTGDKVTKVLASDVVHKVGVSHRNVDKPYISVRTSRSWALVKRCRRPEA
jgi:hypothetical protein